MIDERREPSRASLREFLFFKLLRKNGLIKTRTRLSAGEQKREACEKGPAERPRNIDALKSIYLSVPSVAVVAVHLVIKTGNFNLQRELTKTPLRGSRPRTIPVFVLEWRWRRGDKIK